MKYKVPWKKAPKIKESVLIGHAFNKSGDGFYLYMIDYFGLTAIRDRVSEISKPKGLRWQDSFVPAPKRSK